MEDLLSEFLGPSILLLILDMLIEYPHQWMNLREIARRVDKNPGSISPVIPTLLERGFITDCKVGLSRVVYRLNYDNEKVRALITLRKTLKKTSR